jgi:hypothetical protein
MKFFDIYCGKIYDLLNARKLLALRVDHRSRVNIVGVAEKLV